MLSKLKLNKFEVVNLTYNHRQGSDKIYADLLNRMRVGETTEMDVKLLESRVMTSDDPRLPKEAIFLSAVNEDFNRINEERLEILDSGLLIINAAVSHRTIRKHKPSVTNERKHFQILLKGFLVRRLQRLTNQSSHTVNPRKHA